MLKKIVGLVLVAVLALLAYAATKPDAFVIQRSAVIKAPPGKVFELVNDLRLFNRWNPFLQADPDSKVTYAPGPTVGKGASYSWVGGKSGEGRITIAESLEPSKVLYNLDFVKPMAANNLAEFTVAPSGEGQTTITWAMRGPMPLLSKVMTVFVSLDQMVGPEFEKGLANLKVLAEGS